MFGENFKRKYALTHQGVQNVKKGTFWTVIVNIVVMGGMGILYLLMNHLISLLIKNQAEMNVLVIIGLLIAFVCLSFITHLQQYTSTYGLVYGEVKATRISLAEKLRQLPLGYFHKKDIADLTETLMGDVNRMEHVWSHVLGYLYGSYISTGIIAVFLFIYDWRLAISCLWGVPVAFGLLFGSRQWTSKASQKLKQAAIQVSDGIQESLENVREIRATNQEETYLQGLYQKIDTHEKVMIKGELVAGLFVNGASVIMRLGVATTILVGPSGSGKSTCAKLAARLFDVQKGKITVGGVDINEVDPEVLLSDYSMVFQDVVLFDDSIKENIRLGKRNATDEEVYKAAKAANCDEFVQKLPDGYDTLIGENGTKLSGGERQRISIARALLKDAPIVLLDEATASLDVENETKVQAALSRLLVGKTVLVIAHRMRTVAGADHIVVLDNGHVVEQGSPSELMEKNGIYRRMVDLQSESAQWKMN